MEHADVPALELRSEASPLERARVRRQLTVEGAARLARLTPDEVSWLEQGRFYRFQSSEGAVLAVLLYATAMGIGRREACRLAGLPVLPRPTLTERARRAAAVIAFIVVTAAVVGALTIPRVTHGSGSSPASAALPAPWNVDVDVLNGSGDMNYTRRVASRIGSMAYHVERVSKADRFDYPETAVYFHPGGRQLAERLARELQVPAKPLPGGGNPRRLVVVVGPARL